MIKILIISIVVITIVFTLALCKISSRADRNADIILKKHEDNKNSDHSH